MDKRPDSWEDPPEDEPDPLKEMDEPHLADLIDFVPFEDRDCDYWNRVK